MVLLRARSRYLRGRGGVRRRGRRRLLRGRRWRRSRSLVLLSRRRSLILRRSRGYLLVITTLIITVLSGGRGRGSILGRLLRCRGCLLIRCRSRSIINRCTSIVGRRTRSGRLRSWSYLRGGGRRCLLSCFRHGGSIISRGGVLRGGCLRVRRGICNGLLTGLCSRRLGRGKGWRGLNLLHAGVHIIRSSGGIISWCLSESDCGVHRLRGVH